jgi:hypothetical protein
MIAERILPRLEKVRSTGKETWIACCPAHEDKSPSMTIRETDERLLLHCFAGCDIGAILGAAGMEASDLFADSRESHNPLSRPFPAMDVLRCSRKDFIFLGMVAKDLREGKAISAQDEKHLFTVSKRIDAAVRAGGLN